MKSTLLAFALLPALALAAAPPGRDAPPDPGASSRPEEPQPKTGVPGAREPRELARSEAEPSTGDAQTLAWLHRHNHLQIALGQLAKRHGGSKRLKRFGAMLVKDHTLADAQLTGFARRHRLELAMKAPGARLEAQAEALDRLGLLRGEALDRALVSMAIEEHREAVTRVKATLDETRSAKVHTLLDKLLPVLEEHLLLAEGLQRQQQNV